MDLNKLAEEIYQWRTRNFPSSDLVDGALLVGEESGEVQRCVMKMRDGHRGSREFWMGELKKEMAQVIHSVLTLAQIAGVDDIESVIQKEWDRVKARDLAHPPDDDQG